MITKLSQTFELDLSLDYLERESVNAERSIDWMTSKGESILEWIRNYCNRNKISYEILVHQGEDRFVIFFHSELQRQIFIIKGQIRFPYFEFE